MTNCKQCVCELFEALGDYPETCRCGHPKSQHKPSHDEMVKAAIATFPKYFGLRVFPGKVFTISFTASYVSVDYPNPGDNIFLYTVTKRDGRWQSFCKGSPEELRREITNTVQFPCCGAYGSPNPDHQCDPPRRDPDNS